MPTRLNCPLIHDASPCQILSLLHTLLDEVRTLHQTLESQELSPKATFKSPHKHLHVSALVIALQLEHPDRIWTSESFATEIGCTGAAVRKTQAWKNYNERLAREKHARSQWKGQ